MNNELLAETFCQKCRAKIDAGESRVVVMAVEIAGDDVEEPGRKESHTFTFCLKCVADLPEFTFTNPWKMRSDYLANPPDHRPVVDRHVSLDEMADERRRHSNQSDADALGGLLSSDRDHVSLPPPTKAEREVARFKALPPLYRQIAELRANGKSQAEIAALLGISQQTVSRRIQEIVLLIK